MMRNRGLIGMTALTACMLAVLIGLGLWQLKRLHWKEGLIAQIEARTTAAPMTLAQAIAIARDGGDANYLRVKVEGRFLNDRERYLYALSDETSGWEVVTPLQIADGGVVLIDRGFVPDGLRDPSARTGSQPEDVVSVTGLVRLPERQGLFTPDNDPARNRWFWRDLNGMTVSMFPAGTRLVAPFFLAAEKGGQPDAWPRGGQTRLDLPNNHLQYAVTWFALALCIAGAYGFFVWSRLHEGKD
jgi:surfeit locus 1 family protein